jgi:heavy metal translocating P-type ATPase
MENPSEKLLRELAEEKKELQINVLLTILTLLGLIVGIYAQITQQSVWLQAGGFLMSFLAGGLPATRGALSSLFKGSLNIDLLMVLAAVAAACVGEVRDGAVLLFLFSLAGTLEEYAMGNTKRAVVSLMKMRPDEANVQNAGGLIERVAVELLKIDQVVLVRPGERVPVDGVVISGISAIDQSSVTGESVPVEKSESDSVFAGSVNGHGALLVRVTKLATNSTLSQMIKLVTEAQSKRSPSESFSDWFGQRYTVFVLVGSLLALIAFVALGFPYAEAFYKAATLLVVASPCAIVISVPAAVLSALAASAKQGMLFKGGAALENFGQVDIIAFDKTGTLTEGKMKVVQVNAFLMKENEMLAIAIALESQSEHPLAKSILEYATDKNLKTGEVSVTKAVPGKGLSAKVAGIEYWAGNRKMLADSGVKMSPEVEKTLTALENTGKTAIIVGDSKNVIGIFGIADTVRPSSQFAVAQLRSSGMRRVVMLTGDHSSVAQVIAKDLGISPNDVYADLMPTDKVDIINQLRKEGKVAFVGDGVNDAAALATAHVGIAMGSAGSDVAIEAADVALLSNDMNTIIRARQLSLQTNRIIKQNLIFALGMLLLMVLITVFFYLPLPLGVIGHEGGTLLVVLNGLRLLLKK